MKILRIKDNKGFFCLDDVKNNCVEIDRIDKEKIMKLLDIAVSTDFEMDNYQDEEKEIKNKAHEIIYRNLFDKFEDFKENKSLFKENSEELYKDALKKYGKKEADEKQK